MRPVSSLSCAVSAAPGPLSRPRRNSMTTIIFVIIIVFVFVVFVIGNVPLPSHLLDITLIGTPRPLTPRPTLSDTPAPLALLPAPHTPLPRLSVAVALLFAVAVTLCVVRLIPATPCFLLEHRLGP